MAENIVYWFDLADGVALFKTTSDEKWIVNETFKVNKLYPRYDYIRPVAGGYVLLSTCGDDEVCVVADNGFVLRGSGYYTTNEATFVLGGIAHFTKGWITGDEALEYIETLFPTNSRDKEDFKRFVLGDREGYLEIFNQIKAEE